MAKTAEEEEQVKQLLYTWRDCFAPTLKEMRPTDLVHHTIDLKPNARLVYTKIPRYTIKEREFAE